MEVVEDFESRPHKAVSSLVEREEEIQEWNEQKLPKVLPGYSGGRLSGRSEEERGREEEEEEEDSRERPVRYETAQKKWLRAKAGVHEEAKSIAQRTLGQSVKQSWDCSQIENEEDEDEDWQKGDQMDMQWVDDEKLEEILERSRAEGSSVQAEVFQKVLELVVHERMSQCGKAKGLEEKKKLKGWSIEETKDKQRSSWEEDTEGMIDWRSMSQEEMDQCWKELAEKTEEEVLDKYKVEDNKRGASRGRGSPLGWRLVRRSKKYRIRKWREDCWARILALFRVKACSTCTTCMKIPRKKKR